MNVYVFIRVHAYSQSFWNVFKSAIAPNLSKKRIRLHVIIIYSVYTVIRWTVTREGNKLTILSSDKKKKNKYTIIIIETRGKQCNFMYGTGRMIIRNNRDNAMLQQRITRALLFQRCTYVFGWGVKSFRARELQYYRDGFRRCAERWSFRATYIF